MSLLCAGAGQIGAGGCRRLLLDRIQVKERTRRAEVRNGCRCTV